MEITADKLANEEDILHQGTPVCLDIRSEGIQDVPVRKRFSPPAKDTSIQVHLSEESDNFLELLDMQFDCRDKSFDPTGRLFWKEMRGRLPNLNMATTSVILRRRRYMRNFSKRKLLECKGIVPEQCLAAMDSLVRVFPKMDPESRLDAVEEIYNDIMAQQPTPQTRAIKIFWKTLRGFLTAQAVKHFPEKLVVRRQTAKRSDLARMGRDRYGAVKEYIRIRKRNLPVTIVACCSPVSGSVDERK